MVAGGSHGQGLRVGDGEGAGTGAGGGGRRRGGHASRRRRPVSRRRGATQAMRPTTVEQWCEYYGVEVSDGVATLFKAVDDELRVLPRGLVRAGQRPPGRGLGRRRAGVRRRAALLARGRRSRFPPPTTRRGSWHAPCGSRTSSFHRTAIYPEQGEGAGGVRPGLRGATGTAPGSATTRGVAAPAPAPRERRGHSGASVSSVTGWLASGTGARGSAREEPASRPQLRLAAPLLLRAGPVVVDPQARPGDRACGPGSGHMSSGRCSSSTGSPSR